MTRPMGDGPPQNSVHDGDCPVVVGDVIADKYRVERVLGIGGMGVVVAAWHTELQQRVALKFLRKSFAAHPEAIERFRREARAAARISSDHVVRVFEVGTLESSVPYMVMEYLEGDDLRHLLTASGPLEIPEVAAILLQICNALSDAHANQIIHRDLRPENIYLTCRQGRPPLVKVLDFGVSKSLAPHTMQRLELTPAAAGWPAYLSPEQLDSKRAIDARADVWGAGVLIYELATRHLPFNGNTLHEVVRAVLAGERLPLNRYVQVAPRELERIVSRCLKPYPEDRFASADELAQALRPLAALDNDWADRLLPHLQPNAASAEAYGRAHILGESVGAKQVVIEVGAVSQGAKATRGRSVPPRGNLPRRFALPLGLGLLAGLLLAALLWGRPKTHSAEAAATLRELEPPPRARILAASAQRPPVSPSADATTAKPRATEGDKATKRELPRLIRQHARARNGAAQRAALTVDAIPSTQPSASVAQPPAPTATENYTDFGGRR